MRDQLGGGAILVERLAILRLADAIVSPTRFGG